MHIAFVHPHRAFLPELTAYRRYFGEKGWKTSVWKTGTKEFPPDVKAVWHFMGTHYRRSEAEKKVPVIHEYASLSVPPFRKLKDKIKALAQTRPDFRLFSSEYIRQELGFSDGVPDGIRDMGVYPPTLPQVPDERKEYDFIYVGSMHPHRKPENILHTLSHSSLSRKKILLLGDSTEEFRNAYRDRANIVFHKPVPVSEVPYFLAKSRYAINYIPNVAPFCYQTPTKLLEYCTMQVPVITNTTPWLTDFRKNHGGNFWVTEEMGIPTDEALRGFPFRFPDMRPFYWETRIKNSGVEEFLSTYSN